LVGFQRERFDRGSFGTPPALVLAQEGSTEESS